MAEIRRSCQRSFFFFGWRVAVADNTVCNSRSRTVENEDFWCETVQDVQFYGGGSKTPKVGLNSLQCFSNVKCSFCSFAAGSTNLVGEWWNLLFRNLRDICFQPLHNNGHLINSPMFHSLNILSNVTLSTYPGLKSAVEVHQLEALLTSQIIINYYLFQT